MVILQNLNYIHPNRDPLFTDLDLIINKQNKVALIGNNGTGKSTLLKIIAGILQPLNGVVKTTGKCYYVPQVLGQYNDLTVAEALQVSGKLQALQQILNGDASEENFTLLDDDWAIEKRCAEAFAYWQLDANLDQKMASLSGGQKTKVFLAGISIHDAENILLDEPSNHLDVQSREVLYNYIKTTNNTLIVVSHDKELLNLLGTIYELDKRGINVYSGNYDFYAAQKMIENNALNNDLRDKEKALRKAKITERESVERQQKLDARGKRKQEKAGIPTIFMNTLRNNAEKSTARVKGIHAEKVSGITQELTALRSSLPVRDKMKIDIDNSQLNKNKILVIAEEINFGYDSKMLWLLPLNFRITGSSRTAIKGSNGSGKTTLIKMMLGELMPKAGQLSLTRFNVIYIDQDYSLIDNGLTVYEQAQQYNSSGLQDHEIKIRLNRFLFTGDNWNKPCKALSGGEKMRLMLCALTIGNQAPDMIILDEPTNNLDIQNIEILTAAINEYEGALVVISHDEHFLNEIGIEQSINLENN